MERVVAACKFGVNQVSSYLQGMRDRNRLSKERFIEKTAHMAINFSEGKELKVREVHEILLELQEPCRTLQVTLMLSALASYVLKSVLPSPLRFVSKISGVVFTYCAFECSNINAEIRKELYFFERMNKDSSVKKEAFLESIRILSSHILGAAPVLENFLIYGPSEVYLHLDEKVDAFIGNLPNRSDPIEVAASIRKAIDASKIFQCVI